MLVKDRMSTHPLTISQDESISAAHRYIQEQNIRHLPVVDKSGKMVGIITHDDLLKAEPSGVTLLSVWEIHSLLEKVKVRDVMVRDVITTTEDIPIEDAARLMMDRKIGGLPVMREGRLVGIITDTDILETFLELFSARQKGLRITLEIPDTAGQLAKVSQAIADQGGYIAACGTFMAEDPTKWGLVLKVRNVDHDTLTTALSNIEGERTLDVREV